MSDEVIFSPHFKFDPKRDCHDLRLHGPSPALPPLPKIPGVNVYIFTGDGWRPLESK